MLGYGAGIVLLWDKGTWAPEPGFEDVGKALQRGELKFRLNGVKLKGGWVLVRTGGGAGGRKDADGESRTWLLIKHRDEWAGDVDIAEFAPNSVKSEGDFADILSQEKPDLWESHRPAEGGDAGALFKKIIRKAAELRVQRESRKSPKHKLKRASRRL